MREKGELAVCLSALDKVDTAVMIGTQSIPIRNFYYPQALESARFYDLSEVYWEAFRDVQRNYSIIVGDIPMEFVMSSFRILLGCYGKLSSNSVDWPGYKEIYESIIQSGYTESDDEQRETAPDKRIKRF